MSDCKRADPPVAHCWHPAARIYTGGKPTDTFVTCCWCGVREKQTGPQQSHGGFAPIHDPWRHAS